MGIINTKDLATTIGKNAGMDSSSVSYHIKMAIAQTALQSGYNIKCQAHPSRAIAFDEFSQFIAAEKAEVIYMQVPDTHNPEKKKNAETESRTYYGFVQGDDFIADISFSGEYGSTLTIIAETYERAKEVTGYWLSKLDDPKPASPDSVSVDFWWAGKNGASSLTKKLVLPSWEDIALNYSDKVRQDLGSMMDTVPSQDSGIIVWHGEPGTGKTTAIRALMNSWNEKAQLSVISDPEQLLHSSEYLLSVTMDGEGEDKPHLIILEDSGELVEKQAKINVGQSLARLLNMADGLLGQTLKTFFLITTNEPIGSLHEAVVRNGRCVSNIEFTGLTLEEAQLWAEKNECDLTKIKNKQYTLADLYALAHGGETKQKVKQQSFGFSV